MDPLNFDLKKVKFDRKRTENQTLKILRVGRADHIYPSSIEHHGNEDRSDEHRMQTKILEIGYQ